MEAIVGIDPGAGGGIAVLIGHCVYDTLSLKNATETDIVQFLHPLTNGIDSADDGLHPIFAFIERVHSSPQMGVVSAFTFGRSYGFLRAALMGVALPFDEVTPQKWQKAMGCLSGGDKNVTKAAAQRLFPKTTVTHAIADSLLIAEYGRRLRAGEIGNPKEKQGCS